VKLGFGGLKIPTARTSRDKAAQAADGCAIVIRITPGLRGRTTTVTTPALLLVAETFTPAPRTRTVIPAKGCPSSPVIRITRRDLRPTTKTLLPALSLAAQRTAGGTKGPVVVVVVEGPVPGVVGVVGLVPVVGVVGVVEVVLVVDVVPVVEVVDVVEVVGDVPSHRWPAWP
jgi:hypothetical protein